MRLAYHDACHLAHAQGVRDEPRAVLRAIPGVELVEIPEAAVCCGSAGIYNLVEPEAAGDLGRRKAGNVRAVEPDALAAANPGCLIQIGAHLRAGGGRVVPTFHPVELLAASLAGEHPLDVLARRRRLLASAGTPSRSTG
jgi:glycolate oxidase iron-sulfur subunit